MTGALLTLVYNCQPHAHQDGTQDGMHAHWSTMTLPSDASAAADPRSAGSQIRNGWFSESSPGPVWLMTRWALAQVTTDRHTRNRLESARVYEILRPDQQLLPGIDAVPVATFSALSG